MSKQRTVGVTISGLASAGIHLASAKLRLSTLTRTLTGPLRYYVPQLQEWPRRIRTECEPLDGLTTQGTIELMFTDLDRADVLQFNYGHLILEFFWATTRRAVAALTGSETAGSASFAVETLSSKAADYIVAGDILWINREAVYVSSVAGTPPATLVVQRAVANTIAVVQNQRDPYIFKINPLAIDREVILYDLDLATDTETTRFQGIVEGYAMTSDLKVLSISCRDLLGRISDRTLGEQRFDGKVFVQNYPSTGDDSRLYNLSGDQPVVDYKPIYADNDGTVGAGVAKVIPIEIDGHAVFVTANEVQNNAPGGGTWGYQHSPLGGTGGAAFDGRIIDADEKGKDFTFWEIQPADADNPHSLFRDDNGDRSDHPADIVLCILTSTGTATWPGGGAHTVGTNGAWDWLPQPWGLGLSIALINTGTFETLKERWPTRGIRYRNFYLGAGEEKVKASEVVYDLMQACGSYIYLDATGEIACRHFGDPGPALLDAAITPAEIAWIRGAAASSDAAPQTLESVYTINIETCAQGPGGKPARTIRASDLEQLNVRRLKYLAKEDTIESTHVWGDPVTHSLSDSDVQQIGACFRSRYAYTQGRLPVYDLELAPNATYITAGMWISLTHPALIALDFTRGVTEHRCFVLSADWDPEKYTQKVRVVDWSPASTFDAVISPTWYVATVASTVSLTISATQYTANDLAFWKDAASGQYPLALWTADGVRRSDNGPEGTLAGVTVTLSTAFTLGGGGALTPLVGDVIRIDNWDAADDWYATDAYAYLGDSSGDLSASVVSSDWSV